MSQPHILTSVATYEAITDALYRALRGVDYNDVSVFNSAFVGEDISFTTEQITINSLSALGKVVLGHTGPIGTSHTPSNIRIDVKDGGNTASLTAFVLAQHRLPGTGKDPDAPKLLAGGEYVLDLVEDEADGLWKIKKWVVNVIWRKGDLFVLPQPEQGSG
ncbi:hypothetical protein F5884DRAFT_810559 [Xylogone sp. PMI_703]|nr:hypothetical protein F5884DRAFT_810559 [Xylogone sp. PMI_703]